jgi:NIMA (never in mitosis gene a)-related kinase
MLSKKARDDALNEVRVLQQLSHPCRLRVESACSHPRDILQPATSRELRWADIVRYHDAFVENLKLHIAMEYCVNGDLHDRIQAQRVHGSLFPQAQVLDWMAQLLLALDFMHTKKILHRDLKAKNIFISARNHLKLGDFGVSRCLQSTNQFAHSLVGT